VDLDLFRGVLNHAFAPKPVVIATAIEPLKQR